VTPLLALIRKELASLFGSTTAYLTLTAVALVTALIFFEHLRAYNQILFVYASTNMGGFDSGAIPDYVNLWDTVFFPVMDALGLTLIGVVPLVTMRVFAEERARGTDELLITTALRPGQIVLGKFVACFALIAALLAVSFVYPAVAIERGGVGAEHLAAVFVGLLLLGLGIASIGLACSAHSGSQLVAAVSGWTAAFVLWDFGWALPFVNEPVAGLLEAIALRPRTGRLAEGLVVAADVAYFAGLVMLGMAVAKLSFALRRVRP
jgi:ABC-2 type transport system permease protein